MRSLIVMLLFSSSAYATTSAPPPPRHPAPATVHAHDHAAPAAFGGEQSQRWHADAPLQRAMQQIRSARAHELRSTADAVALAKVIDDAIAYMIRNCSLPADADAALHGVIGQLAAAASALRLEDDPREAIAMLDAALERYALLFDESDASVH